MTFSQFLVDWRTRRVEERIRVRLDLRVTRILFIVIVRGSENLPGRKREVFRAMMINTELVGC